MDEAPERLARMRAYLDGTPDTHLASDDLQWFYDVAIAALLHRAKNPEPGEAVQPEQMWADNDRQCAGRTVRVMRIETDTRGHPCNPPQLCAVCEILTNMDKVQRETDMGKPVKDMRGRITRIRLDRFRPTTTGYRLISDGQTRSANL